MEKEKELVVLFQAAKKAADSAAIAGPPSSSSSGPEVWRCVDALKQLKRFPITYNMLVSTQVGKRLRALTKHPCQKIQLASSNLLDTWKKLVSKETAAAAQAPPKCNDFLRDKFRKILVQALSRVGSEAAAAGHDKEIINKINSCDPLRVAVSVESVMFQKLGADKIKYRSIIFNLKDSRNPDLRRRVLLGEVKTERLVTMTAQEMASDERQRQNQQIQDEGLSKCIIGDQQQDATTDQFKCSKCGQRKCKYYQLQTRSADEPMTTYVTCVNCNNHWKFC